MFPEPETVGAGSGGTNSEKTSPSNPAFFKRMRERRKEGRSTASAKRRAKRCRTNKRVSGGGGGKRKEREEEDGGGTIDSELEEKGIPWWSRREIVGAGRPSLSLVVILGTASPKYTARPRRAT